MTIKISVYASTSSGPPPSETPSYTIDYINEETMEAVVPEHEYSFDGTSYTTGSNNYVTLTPEQTTYFRVKTDPTKLQTLNVPARPSAPSFGIDYTNERTNETISDEYDYSSNSDMSSSSRGVGSYVSLTPGSNKYFRKRATGSAFASNIQSLTVPGRPGAPSFGIDYMNERTSSAVSSDYQYSDNSDMSSATTGTGSQLSLSPGSNKYFRKLGSANQFASSIQNLNVPSRPAAPAFGIDFINSRTSTPVASTHEYGSSSDMSDAVSGSGAYVDIAPLATIYFRTKATASAFLSDIQTLEAPGQPEAPSFQIDYLKEEISSPIGSGYAYGSTPDLSDATQGSDNILKVVPGENLYFQALASASGFASEIQTLVSPVRPGGPSIGINFMNETTDQAITSGLQYSSSPGFEIATGGTGAAMDVIPGADIYFRYIGTASSFASEAFHLQVPERPVIASMETGTTNLYPFIASISFTQEISALESSSLTIVNADMKNLSLKSAGTNETVFEGLVYATAKDVISISIPADATAEGNFVSSKFEILYTGDLPNVGIESSNLNTFTVFPNPGKGVFHMKFENFNPQADYKVDCCSITGELVHSETFFGTEDVRMDLSDLSDGFYLLRLSENGMERGVVKLIIK